MLDHKIIKQSETSAEIEVKLDEAYIKPHKAHVLKHMSKGLKVAGFRPGKLPAHIAEREVGDAQLQSEVIQDVIMHSYGELISKLKLETISEPKISVTKFVPYSALEYKAEMALMPKVVVADPKTLKIKQEKDEVTKAEIDEGLEQLQQRAAKNKKVTRAAKMGDEVKFDFEGTRGGKPVEGAIAKNHVLTLGSGQFIPGFEDNLVGLTSGDKKSFDITFPKEYHSKDLAGAKVTFAIELHEVNERDLPKLDEKFAKEFGGFDTIAKLRADIKKHLEEGKAQQTNKDYRNSVLEAVVAKSKVPVPAMVVERQVEDLRHQMHHELEAAGLDEAKYLEMNNKQKTDYDKELEVEAERRVKLGLILRQVSTDQKIEVNQTELELQAQIMQNQYSDPQAQAEMAKPEFIEDLRNRMMSEKAIDYLVSNTKGGTK